MSDAVLRLTRRRDGTIVLIDADGVVSERAAFPPRHLFLYNWLARIGSVVQISDSSVELNFLNAKATYRIVDREHPQGLDAELVESSISTEPLPPIDEHRAFEIQLERRDREVRALVDEFGVSEGVAEAIAIKFNRIPPAPMEWKVT